jgi:hypothetical protein
VRCLRTCALFLPSSLSTSLPFECLLRFASFLSESNVVRLSSCVCELIEHLNGLFSNFGRQSISWYGKENNVAYVLSFLPLTIYIFSFLDLLFVQVLLCMHTIIKLSQTTSTTTVYKRHQALTLRLKSELQDQIRDQDQISNH